VRADLYFYGANPARLASPKSKRAVMTDIKIRDSIENIYYSCTFIDKIIEFLDTQIENANALKIELERVRAINKELRRESESTKNEIDKHQNEINNYKNKLELVDDCLGVKFEGYYEKWFQSDIKEIADKISTLEKENQELREEINNLTD